MAKYFLQTIAKGKCYLILTPGNCEMAVMTVKIFVPFVVRSVMYEN